MSVSLRRCQLVADTACATETRVRSKVPVVFSELPQQDYLNKPFLLSEFVIVSLSCLAMAHYLDWMGVVGIKV